MRIRPKPNLARIDIVSLLLYHITMRFSQELRTPFFTILFILIGLFLYTKLAGPIPFSVNSITTTKTDVFSVSGTGKATVIPDTAKVSLGITVNRPTVAAAQNEANRIINTITKDLKALAIDEKKIKTINYSVNPNYDFTGGSQRIRDYNVSATLEVEVTPIDKVNDVIDKATADGANTVGNVQFTVEEKKRKELERQARKEAIEEAKKKAQELASDAGMQLGKIINVSESPGFEPRPIFERGAPLAAGGEESTKVEPGETAITTTVTLTYEVL